MRFYKIIISIISGSVLFCASSEANPPSVSYTALSDAARKSGQLARYDNAPSVNRTIDIGKYKLDVKVPKTAGAYDVIPIRYKPRRPADDQVTAIEAVA